MNVIKRASTLPNRAAFSKIFVDKVIKPEHVNVNWIKYCTNLRIKDFCVLARKILIRLILKIYILDQLSILSCL